ncbi:hypothetical protein SESBI_24925 [Sesbania bispinosa]|nr:hypothetical protein SESBI_24925 [Sesbania bispinosa]
MDGHSSTYQVRVLSSSSSNPNYDWVLPEVLEKPSEYLSVQSINKFREECDIGIESDLTEKAKVEVEFPKYLKKKNLSCSNIIEVEGDPSALERLLDKSASTSQNNQSQGPTNPTPSGTPLPPSPKRQRLEDIIEGNFCKATDRARIQKLGLRNTVVMAQRVDRKNFSIKLEVEVGRVTTLSEEVENQKTEIKELETVNQYLTEENTEMSSTISLLREEKERVQTSFEASKTMWQLEEKELKTDLALYHGNGFNKAIEQVQFLYPNVNLSEISMFKEIINGALVDPE